MRTSAKSLYSHLLFNNKTARNRVVVPAMASQTADTNGLATERTFQNYSDLAESGAGLIFVELHSAHGYGLNQWLSPITNQRTDRYGGNLEGRSRLLKELIALIRKELPELLISIRIPGQDCFPGGLTPEDMKTVAKDLESLGVDLLNVSSGIGGWRRPRDRLGEGYLLDEASAIQAAVQIPVIGVGGIESAPFIDSIINAGRVELAAVGRAILQNPRRWKETQLLDYRIELSSPGLSG